MMQYIPIILTSPAFIVLTTFALIGGWFTMQGYWTRWAHRKVDALKTTVEEQAKQIEDLRADVNRLKNQNPYSWLTRAN